MLLNQQHSCRQSGYSLLQIAIALIVVGVLLAAFSGTYKLYKTNVVADSTQKNLDNVIVALRKYKEQHGRYPCPSSLTASRINQPTLYGTEIASCDITLAPVPVGRCRQGVCIEAAHPTKRPGGFPESLRRVIVGGVPFRALQIAEDKTYDGFGSRIVYAISQNATIEGNTESLGMINIVDEKNRELVSPPFSALFALISPGENKHGAYSKDGVLVKQCAQRSGRDFANCNTGFTTGRGAQRGLSQYTVAQEVSVPGRDYYDDQIAYFSQSAPESWVRDSNPLFRENIHTTSPNGSVIVGSDAVASTDIVMSVIAPLGTDAMRIFGSDGTLNSTLFTDTICDENGANCFPLSRLTGNKDDLTPGGMYCETPGEYMVGIAFNATNDVGNKRGAICAPISKVCPPESPVMVGIVKAGPNRGDLICEPEVGPRCPEAQFTLCPGSIKNIEADPPNYGPKRVTVEEGADGQKTGWRPNPNAEPPKDPHAGECYNEAYICSGGTWSVRDTRGTCEFEPRPPREQTAPCSDVLFPGFGWTGTATRTVEVTCDGSKNPSPWDVSNCRCAADTKETEAECPDGKGGNAKTIIESVCSPEGTKGSGDAYYDSPAAPGNCLSGPGCIPDTDILFPGIRRSEDTSECTCTNQTRWEFANCPSGTIRSPDPIPARFTDPPANWPGAPKKGQYRKVTVDPETCAETPDPYNRSNCVCDTAEYIVDLGPAVCGSCKEPSKETFDYDGKRLTRGHIYEVRQNVIGDDGSCNPTSKQIDDTGLCVNADFIWKKKADRGGDGTGNQIIGENCVCGEDTTDSCSPRPNSGNEMFNCSCESAN